MRNEKFGVKMRRMPAEWEKQRCILLSFPHEETDWAEDLQSALTPFIRIAQAIAYNQLVYIVCKDKEAISKHFCSTRNIIFIELSTNDTWIRDYGYISVIDNGKNKLLDFKFNGWGNRFEAYLDNSVNQQLYKKGYMGTTEFEQIDFILEGGSIDSDGAGIIMSTSKCLCNSNRNSISSKNIIEQRLEKYLGIKKILWLDYGYLTGDDTDSHIDTLARFVNKETIVYVKCDKREDEHYTELALMEKQLQGFRNMAGEPYNLIPLPMCKKVINTAGERLPATYANFLITNHALLYPTYNDKSDKVAGEIFADLFPDKEIIPINSLKLIEQGGSLHCSTMQVIR